MRAFFKLLLQTPFFPCKHCLRPSWKIQTRKSPQQTPPLLASQPGSQLAAGCGLSVAAQLRSCTKDRAVKTHEPKNLYSTPSGAPRRVWASRTRMLSTTGALEVGPFGL